MKLPNKVELLFICMGLVVIFGVLSNFFDWALYVCFICLAYPVGFSLVMLAYAWIINPIKALKEKLK